MSDAVEKALRGLATRDHGRLTPKAVVAAARPSRSVLHRYFTWDDGEAARLRREDEARRLIRSIEYVVTTSPFVVNAPIFVRDPMAGSGQGYVSTSSLRSEANMAREVLLEEFGRALSALRRAKAVAAAIGMSKDIERLHFEVQRVEARAQSL